MTAEQKARDLLEQSGVEDAQSWSSGELVFIANLIAEVEQLNAARERANAVATRLEVEVERLRADAERYRWLREQTERVVRPTMSVVAKYMLDRDSSEWVNVACLDDCIDSARGASPSPGDGK
jgi:hypothetical protein